MVTDQQVRRLMMLINKEKTLAIAASKAGMDAKTARKYIKLGKLPSQVKPEHTWRTRTDPFEAVWGEALGFLENNAGLEFKEIGDRQKAPMKIGRVKEMGSGKLFYFHHFSTIWSLLWHHSCSNIYVLYLYIRYQYQGGNIMKPRKKKQLAFVELVESIRVTHDLFSVQAVRAVNISLTLRNWIIGFFIREYEQNGKDRAEYGTQLIERLAAHLQKGIDECYSDRYLRLCRQFYGTYPQIRKSLISKFDLIEKLFPDFLLKYHNRGKRRGQVIFNINFAWHEWHLLKTNKSEIRISKSRCFKQIQNPNVQISKQKLQTVCCCCFCFGHLDFGNLNLFRISDFVLRI